MSVETVKAELAKFLADNFAAHELDLVIDETGCDVNRLFYTPRHKPGDKNWYSAIFAGRALRVEDMPCYPTTVWTGYCRGPRSDADRSKTFTKHRPILSDGFDLIDWNRDRGAWFLVREFFDALQWEIGQDIESRREARILCPNDHAHSAPDDWHGCWIKDGTRKTLCGLQCRAVKRSATTASAVHSSMTPHRRTKLWRLNDGRACPNFRPRKDRQCAGSSNRASDG